jgi:hypothetical protein
MNLVSSGACHTKEGGKPFAGGLPLQSPFGAIHATNITPSKRFGIGAYSLEQFSRAVRNGVRADGGHLYPAMPYTAYTLMSDADIKALYSYFMTSVAPVEAPAPHLRAADRAELHHPSSPVAELAPRYPIRQQARGLGDATEHMAVHIPSKTAAMMLPIKLPLKWRHQS